MVARALHETVEHSPGHIIAAGDMDAVPESGSMRFWTGLDALEGLSVCYRDVWATARSTDSGHTYIPQHPYVTAWDWLFRRIDYILLHCNDDGGFTLAIDRCDRICDGPQTSASDHYGLIGRFRSCHTRSTLAPPDT